MHLQERALGGLRRFYFFIFYREDTEMEGKQCDESLSKNLQPFLFSLSDSAE